ncbi:MAG: fibronectin type protein, partial [Marmoricola sp.]|nr:fibronectin type protein [Marmoricola sp.]
ALVSEPGYVYSPANEHFYEYVPAEGGITWDQASAAAQQRTFQGQSGYLATIPNAQVNELVSSKIDGAEYVWIGARAAQDPEALFARIWTWVGGPLAGQVVSRCSNFEWGCDFVANEGLYSSWAPGEPNNAGAREDVAVTNWGSRGEWNDLPASNTTTGYVVEYGDQALGSSSYQGVVTATSSVALQSAPGVPGNVTAGRGNGKATVGFTAPADNGSPLSGYEISVSGGDSSSTRACSDSPCEVQDLVNGVSYEVRVRAQNLEDGWGAWSDAVSVTPSTVPAAPTGVWAQRGDQSATVGFETPVFDGGAPVTGYTVTSATGAHTATCASSPCPVPGLENGTSYTFTVRASNVAGDSTESEPSQSVVPAGVPGVPTEVSAEHGNGSATVSFTAPADNGSPVSGYTITTLPGGATTSCEASPCTVTGLTNGAAYTFAVHAENGLGSGADSDATQPVTPATVPDAPGAVHATRGDGQVGLSFDPPAFDGGSLVVGYEYSLDAGKTWLPLPTNGTDPVTATLTGLNNGTVYGVAVRARNAEGPSVAAVPGQATPARVPDAPTVIATTRGDGRATVTFVAPDGNGAAVTGYTVTTVPEGAATACPASPCLVEGLTNGTSYTFFVVATNDVGDSEPSAASAAIVPVAPPGAPGHVQLGSRDRAALLAFDPALTDASAPVTGYEASLDGGHTWQPLTTNGTGPITSAVTDLNNGTDYSILVRARNEIGGGEPSTPTHVTPAGPPSAPRDVTATVRGTKADVHWSASTSDGGAPVTGYTVTSSPATAACTTTRTTCALTGLETGTTYTFTVTATNARDGWAGTGAGPGATSSPTTVTERPANPRDVKVAATDRALGIRWTAPDNEGTTPISGWLVSVDGGRHWGRTVARPIARSGASGPIARTWTAVQEPVRNGASYSVMVRGVNASGRGAASAPVDVWAAQWFRDPLSAATRRKEIAVPAHPRRYRGPLRHTTATARSHDGSPAVAAPDLHGRKLQSGQAVNFGLGPLFAYNSTVLSPRGRLAIKAVVPSLSWVTAVTCEGYADYGGRSRWERRLAQQRAVVVCQALRAYGAHVATSVRAYGSSMPVVVGGDRADRAPNRRVVVRITRG